MIDIDTENLVPIRDVPRHIPPRRSGRRLHISAVYRWMQRGIGGVRLERVKIGGATFTSKEAIRRFVSRLNAGNHGSPGTAVEPTASRQKQIDNAAREVEAILNAKKIA